MQFLHLCKYRFKIEPSDAKLASIHGHTILIAEMLKCIRIIIRVILTYVLVFLIQTLFAEYPSRSALSGLSRDLFSLTGCFNPQTVTASSHPGRPN